MKISIILSTVASLTLSSSFINAQPQGEMYHMIDPYQYDSNANSDYFIVSGLEQQAIQPYLPGQPAQPGMYGKQQQGAGIDAQFGGQFGAVQQQQPVYAQSMGGSQFGADQQFGAGDATGFGQQFGAQAGALQQQQAGNTVAGFTMPIGSKPAIYRELPSQQAPTQYLPVVRNYRFIQQPIIQKRIVDQPIQQKRYIQQPVVVGRTIYQPLVRPIVDQTIIQPHVTQGTIITPHVTEQPVVQKHYITQNRYVQQYGQTQSQANPQRQPTTFSQDPPRTLKPQQTAQQPQA